MVGYKPDNDHADNTVLTSASSGGLVTVAAVSASGCTGATQSITLQRSGLTFCVSRAQLFSNFYTFAVTGLSGSPTDYNYQWYSGSSLLFSGTQYSQIIQDITGRPTITVEISRWDNPTCSTTFTFSTGSTGSICNNGSTLSARMATTSQQSSVMISSEPDEDVKNISLYPNPANQTIQIHLPERSREATGQIYSASGKLINSVKLKGDDTLDVSNYTDGVYFILTQGDAGMAYKKLIIKH